MFAVFNLTRELGDHGLNQEDVETLFSLVIGAVGA
jgi:hypothetical protein